MFLISRLIKYRAGHRSKRTRLFAHQACAGLALSSTKKRKQRMDEGVRKQKKFITGLAVEAHRGASTKTGGIERDARQRKTEKGVGDQWFHHGQPPLYCTASLLTRT